MTVDNERVSDYIARLYSMSPSLRQGDYTSDMEVKNFVPTVDDDTARLLAVILRMLRPMRILEIGTSVGFSTASMAMTVKEWGGHITTVEYDESVADQAEANFEKTGVADSITLMRGDAGAIVPNLDGEYDMVFMDVDKRLYPLLLDDCIALLRRGGVMISDDTLFPVMDLDPKWHDQISPVERFNEKVFKSPLLDSVLLPTGDGILISVKR